MFSSQHFCPPHWSHSFLCISSPNHSLLSAQHAQTISIMLSGSCPRHNQCPNASIVHRYAFYHLTTLHMQILRIPAIILSALLNLFRSFTFIAHVLIPYTNTLWTQASYIFPLSFEEMPLFVKAGASSLYFPQSNRSLALDKFYEAISDTVWCKRSTNSKMAAHQLKILIFQLVYNKAAKFQRQLSYFQGG